MAMSKSNKGLLLLIYLLIFSNLTNLHSQDKRTDLPNALSSVTSVNSTSTSVTDTPTKEIELYKLLYENAKKANEEMRTTQYTTIGIVVGFILLILGSQFLYNRRLSAQEINAFETQNNLRFEGFRNEVTNSFESFRVAQNELVRLAIDEQNKKLNDFYKEERGKMFDRLDRHTDRIERQLEIKVKDLKIDIEESKGDLLMTKGDNSGALYNYLNCVEYIVELKSRGSLANTMEKLIPLVEEKREIYESQYTRLEELAKEIKESYNQEMQKYAARLENAYKGKKKSSFNILSGNQFAYNGPAFNSPLGAYAAGVSPYKSSAFVGRALRKVVKPDDKGKDKE